MPPRCTSYRTICHFLALPLLLAACMFPLSIEMIEPRGALDLQFERLTGDLIAQRIDAHRRGEGGPTSKSFHLVNPLLVRRLDEAGKAAIRVGLATDSYAPEFDNELKPHVQDFGLGRPEKGTGTALLVFALPGERLVPTSLPQGDVAYPVGLRLIAVNPSGQVSRIDTTRFFRTPDGLAELPLTGGTWDVRVIFTQPGTEAGGGVGRLGVQLPAAGTLGLSDLVFGRADASLTWNGPAGPVALNPLDVYSREGTVEIYYELGGLTPGAKYRTTIVVEGISGDSEGEVSVAFEETARESFEPTRRSVPLDRLDGGQYRLTVTVVDEQSGLQATRERLINVLGDRGLERRPRLNAATVVR